MWEGLAKGQNGCFPRRMSALIGKTTSATSQHFLTTIKDELSWVELRPQETMRLTFKWDGAWFFGGSLGGRGGKHEQGESLF